MKLAFSAASTQALDRHENGLAQQVTASANPDQISSLGAALILERLGDGEGVNL